MKPPLTVTLDREKLNHPVHVKEEQSIKERRDKEMRKLRKNEGFTLAELLIVVAIIAVLVAVSIPIFTAQLEKSRESTDLANLRAAKAAGVTAYLDNSYYEGADTKKVTKYYNIIKGVLENEGTAAGKGTALEGSSANTNAFESGTFKYNAKTDYKDQKIEVILNYAASADQDAVVVKFSK